VVLAAALLSSVFIKKTAAATGERLLFSSQVVRINYGLLSTSAALQVI